MGATLNLGVFISFSVLLNVTRWKKENKTRGEKKRQAWISQKQLFLLHRVAAVQTPCGCRASCSRLTGGSGADWEGSAVLHHGSYIKLECLDFGFSIAECSTLKTEENQGNGRLVWILRNHSFFATQKCMIERSYIGIAINNIWCPGYKHVLSGDKGSSLDIPYSKPPLLRTRDFRLILSGFCPSHSKNRKTVKLHQRSISL